MLTQTNITYRLFEEADMEGILNLWKNYSGWGGITKEQFNSWYLKTPYGSCIVVVAVDEEDEIVGQEVFIPSHIYLDNKEQKALRISSPILHEKARFTAVTQAEHPIYAMLRCGTEAAIDQGYQLIYMYPAIGWVSTMKLCPRFGLPKIDIATYKCFSISLRSPQTFSEITDAYKVSVLTTDFNYEYDNLWSDAAKQFPIRCGVVRNAKWMNWKAKGTLTLEVRKTEGNQLMGYICLKKKTGLIQDMLARTEKEADEVLQNCIAALHHLNPQRISTDFDNVNGMLTPLFITLLKPIPWEYQNFDFAFGCFSINNKIDHSTYETANWYMMPND